MKIEITHRTNWWKIITSIFLVCFGILFWYRETEYFGFNEKPSCRFEELCDTASLIFVIIGIYIASTSMITDHKLTN
jgi:hypothetical protein